MFGVCMPYITKDERNKNDKTLLISSLKEKTALENNISKDKFSLNNTEQVRLMAPFVQLKRKYDDLGNSHGITLRQNILFK